jgi:arabinose-5-phosphate isomerase
MSAFDAIAVGRKVLAAEAEALSQLASGLDEAFTRAVETLFDAKGRIVLTGIGKSGHVARKIAATLASTGSVAMFVHATEASHGDLGMIGADDVILALSKTGETRELADVIAYAVRFGIPLIAITAVADSALGRASDIVLRIPDAGSRRRTERAHHVHDPADGAGRRAGGGPAAAARVQAARLPGFPSRRQTRRHAEDCRRSDA